LTSTPRTAAPVDVLVGAAPPLLDDRLVAVAELSDGVDILPGYESESSSRDVTLVEGDGTEKIVVGVGVEDPVKAAQIVEYWLALNGVCFIQQEKHSDDILAVVSHSHAQSS